LCQAKPELSVDLEAVIIRLCPQFPFSVIEFPMDAGEIAVGKAFGLDPQKGLP
jgi:hypothetical protein